MDIERLRTIVGTVDCEENFSFAKHTTYGCGGTAAKAYFPKNIRQAVCVYKYLKASGEKFVTLGNGSNVLASDKPFDGRGYRVLFCGDKRRRNAKILRRQ